MKKVTTSLAILLALCSMCLVFFGGCNFYSHKYDRSSVSLMSAEEKEDGLYIYYGYWHKLVYKYASKELREEQAEKEATLPEIVLKGRSTEQDNLDVAKGYEKLKEQVMSLATDTDYPIVHSLAYKEGNTIYGFCNVYSKSSEFSDGLDESGIKCGILFKYDQETNELTVIEELEKCVVVAFDGTGVIWFENIAYYGKLIGGEKVKICDDEAYRATPSTTDNVEFYFGCGYCLIYFCHRDKEEYILGYDKYVLVKMSGEKLAEYKEMQ